MDFDNWLAAVDVKMVEQFGLTSWDMPDWCWWDLWDDGLTPAEAVHDYLEGEGWFA